MHNSVGVWDVLVCRLSCELINPWSYVKEMEVLYLESVIAPPIILFDNIEEQATWPGLKTDELAINGW